MLFPRLIHLLVRLLAVALVLAAAQVGAQPVAQPAPDPNAYMWSSSTSVSAMLNRGGPTTMNQLSLRGGVSAIRPTRSFDVQIEHSLLETTSRGSQLPDGSYSATGQDNTHVRFTVRQTLSEYTYLLARPSFMRDEVLKVDSHYDALAGFGYWHGNDRVRIDLIPVAGVVVQQKNIDALNGTTSTAGIVQQLTAQVGGNWQLLQSFAFLNNFNGGDDHRMQTRITARGRLAGPFSLQIAYSSDYQNRVFHDPNNQIGFPPTYTTQIVTVGIQIQFPTSQ